MHPTAKHSHNNHPRNDDDAFINYVNAVDDPGEVTVSGVDSGNANNGRGSERTTRSPSRAFTAMPSSASASNSYRHRTTQRSNRTGHVELTRESYWERNQPKYEKTDWASTTVQLPIIAPHSEIKQIKHHIHHQTVEHIRSARSTWQDKNDLLLSRFIEQAQLARTEARASTKDLLLYENDCYVFEDAELLDQNASIINVAGGGEYNNHIRQRTRYIRFTLMIRPRDIDTNSKRVTAKTLPCTQSQSVYLRVLRDDNNGMSDAMTRQILDNDLKQLLDIWDTAGEPFDLMMKIREGDPSTHRFKNWMDEVRAETTFKALAEVTAIESIGKIKGLESITLRLAKIQQVSYDPKTKGSVYYPTQQLHEQFQSILAEIDDGDPTEGAYIPSIAHMFFDALSHRLKTRVESSLPARNADDFQTNLNRYHAFRAEVEKEEENIGSFVNIARSVQSKQRGETPTWTRKKNTPRTFMMKRGQGEEDSAEEDESTDEESEMVIMPPKTFLAGQGKSEQTTAKVMKGLITCLSVAETALIDAG
jgi:hypothetical protein